MRHPPRSFLLVTARADTLVATAVVPMIRLREQRTAAGRKAPSAGQWDHG
ncbi:hypothetical protein [Streptomyces sp. NPDC001843]